MKRREPGPLLSGAASRSMPFSREFSFIGPSPQLRADALHGKLEDISWIEEQPWEESLVITAAQPTQVSDVDDDLERELAFYNQV